ncbi:hypothetical protein I6H67_04005 [Pediococcus pentosaceus]|uniref:hypothetical protein n=1 Tax=Pediococcus pentosaceus TaxID=1255 RepID=UPI0018E180E0|nr:hypothetical protein [Pediococcus pentosaceus]MBF7104609.1 hypothetical protein [Pediococcus pentosaceus]QQC62022.1 hypothetical protein I6H67_04005 [Pediococcus pentosaceus]
MASNNIQEAIRGTVKGTINKLYESELQETKKYDSCRYCHEPFECLGGVANHDAVCTVQLSELLDDEENLIKFCPVCGRDLSIGSYKDMLKEARDKTIEQLNTQSDGTQEK